MSNRNQKRLLPLSPEIINRLSEIGEGCPRKGFHKIYEILLTPCNGGGTPLRSDAEPEERIEEEVRPVA
jgi:hypothetical protein